jgi:putative DNA primase/helicase
VSANDLKMLQAAAELPPEPMTPRYECRQDGVFYFGTTVSKQSGELIELPPIWLSDRLDIIGSGIDDSGDAYRLVKWSSRVDRKAHTTAMANGSIGDHEGWSRLRAGGLAVSSRRPMQEHLAMYLQTEGSNAIHHVTDRGGWRNGAYILPSGEVIGTAIPPVFYNGDDSCAATYKPRGTVEGWRDSVAKLARGNSRPMLAIGVALAAPLLHLVELESGGIHLFGPSGCGKTTSAKAGASVWGEPRGQILNWDSTPLALANAAAARNDGLMLLDEMGQGDPRAVSMAAYRLFNGVGKMQGAKDGGNRDQARWRVLLLSTGEIDLSAFMNSGGHRTHAGQEVRLASLPADAGKGLGAFDTLNDHVSSGELAEALEQAANAEHGTVGRAFVAHVAQQFDVISSRLHGAIQDVRRELPPNTSGQARRVATRFAVIAEALEIASEVGLSGWNPGEGRSAVFRCLAEWMDRYGIDNREDIQIIEQAEGWFALHGFGRFIDCSAARGEKEPDVKNCAGYRKRSREELFWLVFPHVFANEVAEGFDPKVAADVLAKAGMLKRANDGIATSKHRTPDYPKERRFYKFTCTERSEADTN